MTKLIGSLAFAAMTLALSPQAALAYDVPIQASFTAAFSAAPSADNTAYCGGTAGPTAIEAHGGGYSNLGALDFALQKTQAGTAFHGCLVLTTPNGDTLTATYEISRTLFALSRREVRDNSYLNAWAPMVQSAPGQNFFPRSYK